MASLPTRPTVTFINLIGSLVHNGQLRRNLSMRLQGVSSDETHSAKNLDTLVSTIFAHLPKRQLLE